MNLNNLPAGDSYTQNLDQQQENVEDLSNNQLQIGASVRRELFQKHQEDLLIRKNSLQVDQEIVYQPTQKNENQANYLKRQRKQTQFKTMKEADFENKSPFIQDKTSYDNKFSFIQQLKKAQLITKCRSRFLSLVARLNYGKLSRSHFNIIGDKTHFPSAAQDNLLGNQLTCCKCKLNLLSFSKWVNKVPVLYPNHILVLCWQLNLVALILLFLYTSPMLLALKMADEQSSIIYYSIFAFSFNILLNLNIGVYQEGQIITDRLEIVKKQFLWRFLIDLVSIVAITSTLKELMLITFIARIPELIKLINNLDEWFQLTERFFTFIELMKLALLIFYLAHYVACGFIYISRDQEMGQSWIEAYDLDHSSPQVQYINSLYFSFVLMLTIGFGDITPHTVKEKIFIIVIAQIGCGIFGYSINTIGAIFQQRAIKENNFKQIIHSHYNIHYFVFFLLDINFVYYGQFGLLKVIFFLIKRKMKFDISNYMKSRNISKKTQLKAIKFLEYMQTSSDFNLNGNTSKGEVVLSHLSKSIKDDVYREFFGQIIVNSKLFGCNFSHRFLNELSLKMQELTLTPGEVLFKKGERDTRIFYINRGYVENYADINNEGKEAVFNTFQVKLFFIINKQKYYHQLKQGDFLGEMSFFTGSPRETNIRSIKITHLIYCTQDDFLHSVKSYQSDYERYCMIRDNYIFNEKHVEKKCQLCNDFSHPSNKCNLIQLNVNKYLVTGRHACSQTIRERIYIERSSRIYFNSIKDRKVIQETARNTRLIIVGEASSQGCPPKVDSLSQYKSDKEFVLQVPQIRFEENFLVVESDASGSQISELEQGSGKGKSEIFQQQVSGVEPGQQHTQTSININQNKKSASQLSNQLQNIEELNSPLQQQQPQPAQPTFSSEKQIICPSEDQQAKPENHIGEQSGKNEEDKIQIHNYALYEQNDQIIMKEGPPDFCKQSSDAVSNRSGYNQQVSNIGEVAGSSSASENQSSSQQLIKNQLEKQRKQRQRRTITMQNGLHQLNSQKSDGQFSSSGRQRSLQNYEKKVFSAQKQSSISNVYGSQIKIEVGEDQRCNREDSFSVKQQKSDGSSRMGCKNAGNEILMQLSKISELLHEGHRRQQQQQLDNQQAPALTNNFIYEGPSGVGKQDDLLNFDNVKVFLNYFPSFNLSRVLDESKKKVNKKKDKQKNTVLIICQ